MTSLADDGRPRRSASPRPDDRPRSASALLSETEGRGKGLSFYAKFRTVADRLSPFCLGVDPSPELLKRRRLPPDACGLKRFCRIVLDAACGRIGIVKPQAACFEAFGVAGMSVLADFIGEARENGMLVIADVKRSDVDHSMAAYARAWLGDDSAFAADAVTVVPWFGFDALRPVFDRAAEQGAGAFAVILSSNRQAAAVQGALDDGVALADRLADRIAAFNARLGDGCGPVHAVIGAGLGPASAKTVRRLPSSLFLTPGLGAQGGDFDDLEIPFATAADRVIPVASRSVLACGPDTQSLAEAIQRHADRAKRFGRPAGKTGGKAGGKAE